MKTFSASAIAVEELEDLNTFSIVMAESCEGFGSRLEIHRALNFDDADRELGMDTYCLCTESGATYYGGVSKWDLDHNRLYLFLNDDACRILNVQGGFEIDVHLSSNEVYILYAALLRVLGFGS